MDAVAPFAVLLSALLAILADLSLGLEAVTQFAVPVADVTSFAPGPAFVTEEWVAETLGDDWAFVYRNREYLLAGTAVTIALTATSILLGFLAGFPAGAIETYGDGYAQTVVRKFGVLLRGTPILVIIIFAFYVLPIEYVLGPVRATLDAIDFVLGPTPFTVPPVSDAFVAATLALGLRSAAYQSQIFRGALRSVDEGQLQAARSIGMSRLEAIRHVVVPQALRRSVPGFQNEFTIVLKDTSIAFAIGLGELLKRTNDLFIQETTAILELVLFASLLYFVLTFGTNRTLDFVSDRYAIPGEST